MKTTVQKEQLSYIPPSPLKRDWEGDKAPEQGALAVKIKSVHKFISENSIEFFMETGVSNSYLGYIVPIQNTNSVAVYLVDPHGGISCNWGLSLEEARASLAWCR